MSYMKGKGVYNVQTKTGALIVAAGMSSRMKQMKQLMEIDGLPMAARVVENFRQAGIEDIAMVLGNGAEQIREALSDWNVTFLFNPDYATTQMFESAQIGFRYMLTQGYDKILFCPVDIPLFSPQLVQCLLKQEGDWIIPSANGRAGHPIVLNGNILPQITATEAEGGLKGALKSAGILPVYMETDEEGILLDADTPEQFAHIVSKVQEN